MGNWLVGVANCGFGRFQGLKQGALLNEILADSDGRLHCKR
jgi:hypothetical protein